MAFFLHRNSLTRPIFQQRLGLTNPVGVQPSTQATETQLPSTRRFANMYLDFTPGGLVKEHGVRFCGSHSIRDLGWVVTRRMSHGIPSGSQENWCRIPVVSSPTTPTLKWSKIMVSQYRQPPATIRLTPSNDFHFSVRCRA